MAISTGDIQTDAISRIQTEVEAGRHVNLTLANLCFIFKKKYEFDGADIRTDFQDMYDYLNAQPWVAGNNFICYSDWVHQVIGLAKEPVPSTT